MISGKPLIQPNFIPWILAILVIATRLPFLFDGFGHEEDSWGLVVNAFEMHSTGVYHASRFPGHPLQEYVYALIWNQPAWLWNALSMLFSAAALIAFYKSVHKIGYNYAFEAALILAFTPEFFTAGTYTIDYAWGLAFILFSLVFLLRRNYWLAGILLGMAIGCRITSMIFLLPWIILLWNKLDAKQWFIDALKVGIACCVVGILWYVPAYMNYGMAFFDYSDQFPYPPIAKVIYKATLGVFGFLGLLAIGIAFTASLIRKNKSVENPPALVTPTRMIVAIAVIIFLQVIAYLRLPQKSGYLLPLVPFVIMLIVMFSTKKMVRIATVMFIAAPFLFSINLTDPLRGAESSPLALKFHASGQEIFLDPVSGPIFSEQSKRRNKMEYVERVCDYLDTTDHSQILICGWWYNEILIQKISHDLEDKNRPHHPGRDVRLSFYVPCDSLTLDWNAIRAAEWYKENEKPCPYMKETYKIYYLPEQNLYNDQMYGQSCTDSLAEPFPVR